MDSGVVYADLYGDGPRGVVLAHGGRFTKESWAVQGAALAEAGFRALAIDFRGRGQSHGGPGHEGNDGAEYDVLAAADYLRRTGASSVSVVGASFGGWASARAVLAAPGAIDRLVLMAAPPIDDPERLAGRKLFIVSRRDSMGSGRLRLPGIRDQFMRAPDPKELLVLEGGAHAQFLFETDQADRLWKAIVDFLSAP